MKNILIICSIFAPENRIGAIRPTKIGKYLKKIGNYYITVLTEDKEILHKDELLEQDLVYFDDVIRIKQSKLLIILNFVIKTFFKRRHKKKEDIEIINPYNRKPSKSNKIKSDLKSKIMRKIKKHSSLYFYFLNDIINSLDFFFNAKSYLKSSNKEFDVIFSTYGPFSSHWIGRYAKNLLPNAVWICDYRDSVYSEDSTPFGFKNFSKSFAKRVSKTADIITAVSQGCLDTLFINNKIKTAVIPNGFDKEDLGDFSVQRNLDKFIFTYTGALYSGKRDLSITFKAIDELINEGKVDKSLIEVHYAGDSFSDIFYQANKFNLEMLLVNHGSVTRKKSLELQINSNILLLASWNTNESSGIVTGKFLEYLMINKPIVCNITGNKPISILKEMINESQVGVCCEEACLNEDYNYLKSYIEKLYKCWIKGLEISFNPNKVYIKKYNYRQIAILINTIIEEYSALT